MCTYGKKIYIFGGAGAYVNQLKQRMGFNDIHILDTESETWTEPTIEGAPNKRYYHTAATYGSVLVVHGGYFAD